MSQKYLWNIAIQQAFGCSSSWANLWCSGCSSLEERLLWNRQDFLIVRWNRRVCARKMHLQCISNGAIFPCNNPSKSSKFVLITIWCVKIVRCGRKMLKNIRVYISKAGYTYKLIYVCVYSIAIFMLTYVNLDTHIDSYICMHRLNKHA